MNCRRPRLPSSLTALVIPETHFKKLLADDVLLASFPKSGNTWVRFIFANIVNLIESEDREVDYHFLNGPFVAELDTGKFGELVYHCIPRFVKTHEEYDLKLFGTCKSVYLFRNPGDVMVSFYEHQQSLKEGKGFPDDTSLATFIRNETFGIDVWCRHVRDWLKACTVCISYEDLKIDPLYTIKGMLQVLNAPAIPDSILYEAIRRSDFSSIKRIEESKGLNPAAAALHKPGFRFARQGTVGQWLERLTDEDVQFINSRLDHHNLQNFHLKPDTSRLGMADAEATNHITRLTRREEWGPAARIINGVDGNDPQYPESKMATALLHYNAGYPEAVLKLLEDTSPEDLLYDKAKDFEKQVKKSPKRNNTIRRLMSEGDMEQAAKQLDKAGISVKKDMDLWFLKSVCLYKAGEIRRSAENLKELIAMQPLHSRAKSLLQVISRRYDLGEPDNGPASAPGKELVPVSPLTGSDRVVRVRSIPSAFAIKQYREQFNVDVTRFFEGLNTIGVYKCLDTGYRFYYPWHVAGDGKFYEDLQVLPWYYMEWKWEHEVARELVNPGQRVLEVGCGSGSFIEKLYGEGIECTGLELNEDAVSKAQQKGLSILNESIENHALPHSGHYDIVSSFQVVEHIPHILSFLKSSLQALKSGGKLLVSVPNHDSMYALDPNNILDIPPHHMGRWNERSLINLQHILGIQLVKLHIEPLQEYHIDYMKNVIAAQVTDHLGIQDHLGRFLDRYHSKIKGFTIMAEYEKPGGNK